MRQAIKGKVCTLNFEFMMTKFILEEHELGTMIPANETEEQRDRRITNRDEHRVRMREMRAMWTNIYAKAQRDAQGRIDAGATPTEAARLARKRDLYARMKDHPPQGEFDLARIRTHEDVAARMPIPFWCRKKAGRRQTLRRELYSKDALISLFRECRDIIDIR
jgi:hypothetical protein